MRRRRLAALVAAVGVVGTLVAAPAASAGAAKPAIVRTVPASVPFDCSADVTDALVGFVRASPDRSVVQFRKDACYRVDGTFAIVDRHRITIEGRGATLRAVTPNDGGRRHVMIVGGSHVTIRDLSVEGTNTAAGAVKTAYVPRLEFQHAFALLGTKHVLLERVRASRVHGDFVYIGPTGDRDRPDFRWSRDVRVTRSTFRGGGRQGVAITAGRRIRIDRNTIADVPRSLFDLESSGPEGGAVDVRIERNTTGAAVNFWLANGGGGLQTKRVTLDRNTMTAPTGGLVFVYGPTSGYRGPYTFTRNVVQFTDRVHDEGSSGAFFLAGARAVTIARNSGVFPASPVVPVAVSRGSVDVVVRGNDFTNAGEQLVSQPRAGQVPADG